MIAIRALRGTATLSDSWCQAKVPVQLPTRRRWPTGVRSSPKKINHQPRLLVRRAAGAYVVAAHPQRNVDAIPPAVDGQGL